MKQFFDLKNLGAAFSLANLWFITFWKQLIYSPDKHYFNFAPHSPAEHFAVAINVLVLTSVFFLLLKLADIFSNDWLERLFRLIFLALGISAFGALSGEIIKWFSPGAINFVNLPLPIIALAACLIFAVKRKLQISVVAENLKLIALFLLPFSFLIFLQLAWNGLVTAPEVLSPQSIEKEFSVNEKPKLSRKVIWIIFDEADYAALDTASRNNADLADFERLMNQSLTARNAVPPSDFTGKSIPALLTGKIVRSFDYAAANDLTLHPADQSESFSFRHSSNIFSEVRNLGGESAVAGFLHPYSRIFQGQTAYAFWQSGKHPPCTNFNRLAACSINIFIDSLLNVPLMARFFPSLWTANVAFSNDKREWQIERTRFLTEKADELISNPRLNFLFFHFSIPHSPYLGRRDLEGKETYFDSLEASNDILKRLRQTLEANGQWNDTAVIVSSDHWWRFKEAKDFDYLPEEERQKALKDIRIPFIVKLPGQTSRMNYEPFFNTVITKQLVLAIFKDEIETPQDLAAWLDDLRRTKPELIEQPPSVENDWGDRWQRQAADFE